MLCICVRCDNLPLYVTKINNIASLFDYLIFLTCDLRGLLYYNLSYFLKIFVCNNITASPSQNFRNLYHTHFLLFQIRDHLLGGYQEREKLVPRSVLFCWKQFHGNYHLELYLMPGVNRHVYYPAYNSDFPLNIRLINSSSLPQFPPMW